MQTYASESVTEGHPDKICDQISDAVLDDILEHNLGEDREKARVACEVSITAGLVVVMGEITSNYTPNYTEIVKRTLKEIGYTDSKYGFDCESCIIIPAAHGQSLNIARGTSEDDLGAGDQGMMFGYATNETTEFMPLPISLAHKLTRQLAEVRKNQTLPYLGPDGKSQVTVEYHDGERPRVTRIVLAAQHFEKIKLKDIKQDLIRTVVDPIKAANPDVLWDSLGSDDIIVNGTSRGEESAFYIGGPQGDTGLTGRKIIVDTYGGIGRHGGGAFSGKDPTKVDRSANYLCRYVSKNITAAGLAARCEFHVAYAIGKQDPVAIGINTFGTHHPKISDAKLGEVVRELFPVRPADIIKHLKLRDPSSFPFYRKTAAYGHFGREDEGFTWEKLDKVEALREATGI